MSNFRNTHFLWLSAMVFPLLLGVPWILLTNGMLPGKAGTLIGFVLLLTGTVAAVDDHFRGKIPNWATYTALVWIFVLNLFGASFSGRNVLGTVGITFSFAGAMSCFVIVLVPYLLGMGGAGDAKMAAVIGAGLGVADGLLALALTFIIAAVTMLLLTAAKKGPIFILYALYRRVGSWFVFWIVPPDHEQKAFLTEPLPMGQSFFFGTFFTVTGIFQTLLQLP
jgi:Flp pilus assembly protein protease CpaA